MGYYSTRFPRIPTHIDRELQKKVTKMREKRERRRRNLQDLGVFQKGIQVLAISPEVIWNYL